MDIPWSLWLSCLSCVPSQSLSHYQHIGLWDVWRESLDSPQALLSDSQNIGVVPTLC